MADSADDVGDVVEFWEELEGAEQLKELALFVLWLPPFVTGRDSVMKSMFRKSQSKAEFGATWAQAFLRLNGAVHHTPADGKVTGIKLPRYPQYFGDVSHRVPSE